MGAECRPLGGKESLDLGRIDGLDNGCQRVAKGGQELPDQADAAKMGAGQDGAVPGAKRSLQVVQTVDFDHAHDLGG